MEEADRERKEADRELQLRMEEADRERRDLQRQLEEARRQPAQQDESKTVTELAGRSACCNSRGAGAASARCVAVGVRTRRLTRARWCARTAGFVNPLKPWKVREYTGSPSTLLARDEDLAALSVVDATSERVQTWLHEADAKHASGRKCQLDAPSVQRLLEVLPQSDVVRQIACRW